MFSCISWCVLIIIQVLKEGGGLIFEQLLNPSLSPSGSLSSVIKNPSLNKMFGLGILWGVREGWLS